MSVTVDVNLLWLVPGAVGGSEQSTLATLHGWRQLEPSDLRLRLFVLEPFVKAHPDVVAAFPTEVLPSTGHSRLRRIGAEATWLAGRTRGSDLVHHAGGTAPIRRSAPYVLTLHDLQPLERGETHGWAKRAYLRARVPPSVKEARLIAVGSEFVRRAVLERFELDPTRVVTIPHGVERHVPGGSTADGVRARYGLRGPFVLYPAITYPHKNHATLIEAFDAVHREHPDALLVLTGAEGACEAQVADQVASLGLQDQVRRLGRVSDADVAGLFAAAEIVAIPSRYEGFGVPAAEAMAVGVALVVADATALPEVVGDAGVLVDPDDPAAWADAINNLLHDPVERSRLTARGLERARPYQREANAKAFADLYRRALAG